jgi:hypothetical protein
MGSEAPDWAKAEIAEAIRILKDDGLHIHKTYKSFMSSQTEDDDKTTETQDTEGQPPPAKEKAADKPAKSSLWWGNRS